MAHIPHCYSYSRLTIFLSKSRNKNNYNFPSVPYRLPGSCCLPILSGPETTEAKTTGVKKPADIMKGGRKNLKRACTEEIPTLLEGQSIMQVVSLRGSNLIEVMDAAGQKSLALFPAKFQKSMWIRRGSFVVVDESGKEKALESGSKVACLVVQVLFYEQVYALQKSTEWPEIFRTAAMDASKSHMQMLTANPEEEGNSSDSDGLAPLESNLNRTRPVELYSDSESNSDADS